MPSTRRNPDNEEAGEKWFFRHAGSQYGPYDVDSLKDLITAAGIDSDLEIRGEQNREWVRVTSVDEWLQGDSPTDALQHDGQAEPQKSSRASEKSGSHRDEKGAKLNTDQLLHRRNPLAHARRQSQSSDLWTSSDVKVLAGLLIVWITLNVVTFFVVSDPYQVERQYSATFVEIWNEVKLARQRDASDSEWKALEGRSTQRLAPIIKDLEKTADKQNPIRQYLLWAGRDYLLKLVRNSRDNFDEYEQLFLKHMQNAESLLSTR